MLTSGLLVAFFVYQVQSQGTCKSPYVEQRLLADDVRYASPFYVVALPKTPQTLEMDNICYTYYEKDEGGFFHVMSITYKNGTNTYYDFSKGDISNRMGIAEAKSNECVFHDYTLKPICNMTVFILYRCYIQGKCTSNIDISPIPGVDVRVTLAASPKLSPECRAETESSLRDTSALAGGDYVILPQKRTPNCVTKYDNLVSIGSNRALGPKAVTNELIDRFAEQPPSSVQPTNPTATQSQSSFFRQGIPPPSAFNPYGYSTNRASAPSAPATNTPAGGSSQTYSYGNSYAHATKNSVDPSTTQRLPTAGHSPAMVWSNVPGSPSQWNGQSIPSGAEMHYHIWQAAATTAAMKTMTGKNPNVYYHVHSWAPSQGCCKCS